MEIGFAALLKVQDVEQLWLQNYGGVFERLKLAKNRGFSTVELCSDSEIVVKCFKQNSTGSAIRWSLIQRI